jgi:hypothetical protein
MTSDPIENEFWRVFARAMGRELAPGRYAVGELAPWDSLRHVELVFELEEAFRIRVPPDAIAGLFSDTDRVLAFVRAAVEARR